MNRATNNIPSHPSKIMMNTGVDSWLVAYNGLTLVKILFINKGEIYL